MSTQSIAQAPQHAHRADTTTGAHTPWAHALRAAALAAAIVCVVLIAFAWPSVTAKVQNLPIAAVGSPDQISQVTSKAPQGALDVRTASSRDDAIAQIQRREVYGAIVLGKSPEILVASAASPVASQALTQIGAQMQQGIQQQVIAQLKQALQQAQQRAQSPQAGAPQTGAPQGATPAAGSQAVPTVTVTDVAPLSSDDPRGTGLAIAGLPLVIGGILGGVLISLLVSGTWRRFGAVLAYGVAGGLGLAGILQGWFHILQSSYLLNAAAIGLGIAATAAIITGLNALIGRAGIALGAVITILIGNPISSLTQPREFLPAPWGDVGQWFVPGASGTLLRELSYFPSADAAFPWLVLAGWAVVGALLIAVGRFRNQPTAVEV
ncbi:ABC transporter permease [Sinomonas sp. ASV322]|uniref:ABC transporter permease n=1 Tax=Sinomonas sp. ASV322 TaxID=3041920 RepID=UPI0027DCB982|nr:ABC transporter permease [Sinomonas sp. ASV322]MDQ4500737.1 ABC transporter permease [Sinomonas sp. ASV322]